MIPHIDSNGIMKCLLTESENAFLSSCTQKLNWNIDDFNRIYDLTDKEKETKDVVYLIVLCDWISETSCKIFDIYKKYQKCFKYNYSVLKEKEKEFKAIRSFLVAHPLNTNRHKEYGYDGTKCAIDIQLNVRFPLCNIDCSKGDDYYILWCCQKDICYSYEGHSFNELYDFANETVTWTNAFLRYLSKIRKKNLREFN